MTIADPPRRWDPERHAHRLAPAGALLTVTGGCLGGVPGLLVAAVGVALLLASCYSARDGLLLLGPLTHAELLRAARRQRPWLWRAVYALAAGAVILGNIETYVPGLLSPSPPYFPPSQIANVNHRISVWFAAGLAVYAIVLTLQLMPSIVAEEREAKRWDILLATDLRPREILLGKATARLLRVGEPLLAVLPVLAIMPLLGGIDPAAVALFGVALLAVVASTTAVAVFNSVFAETTADAHGRTVGWLIGYYVGTGFLHAASSFAMFANFPANCGVPSPVLFVDVARWAAVGHPVALLRPAVGAGAGFADTLVAGLPPFLAFHAGVVLLYGLTACRRLRFAVPWRKQSGRAARRVRRAEAGGGPTPDVPVFAATAIARPPMGDRPLAWWTRYGHRRGRLAADIANPRKFYAVMFGVFLLMFAAVYPLDLAWPWGRGVWPEAVRNGVPFLAWMLTFPLFLRPLFHAAGTIAGERQADTLTCILLTPLSSREIVTQKWRGSVLEPMSVYYLLLAVGLAATLTGFLHPLTLPALAVVVWPGMMLAAAIGVYFSAGAATTARAKLWTFLAVFGGGAIGLTAVGRLVDRLGGGSGENLFAFIVVAIPHATTCYPALSSSGVFRTASPVHFALTVATVFGCVVQSLAAYTILGAAVERFRRSRGK